MLIRLQDAVADADSSSLAVDEGVSVALSLGSVLTSGGGHAIRAVGPPRMRIAGLAQGRNHIALHVEHVRAVRMRLPADDEILKIILGGVQLFILRKEGKIMVKIKGLQPGGSITLGTSCSPTLQSLASSSSCSLSSTLCGAFFCSSSGSSSSSSSMVSVDSSEDSSEVTVAGDSDFRRVLDAEEVALVMGLAEAAAAGRCCSHLCFMHSAAVMRVLRGKGNSNQDDEVRTRL